MSSPYPEGGPPSGAPGGKTSLGLDSNLGAMLCYIANILCCLGIILSIVFLITEKENRFVKFHALQSLFLFAVYAALAIAVEIIGLVLNIAIGGVLSGLVTWGLWCIVGVSSLSLLWFSGYWRG